MVVRVEAIDRSRRNDDICFCCLTGRDRGRMAEERDETRSNDTRDGRVGDIRPSPRHASRRASREGHLHKPFFRSRKPSPRQRQETHRVRRRVESNLEARPRWPQIVRLDLRAPLQRAVALLRRSTGIFDAHADMRFLTTITGLSWHRIASQRLAILQPRRQDRGWLCNRCCTRGWLCVAHTGCR